MKQGRSYYITVYQKAEKLGDCASVAVEMPSGHFEGPIKQKHLSWKLPGWSTIILQNIIHCCDDGFQFVAWVCNSLVFFAFL